MALISPRGLRIFSKPARSPAHLQQQDRTIKQKRRRSYRDVARRLFWRFVAYFFLVVPDALMLVTVYFTCLWMRVNDLMYRMKTREFPPLVRPHQKAMVWTHCDQLSSTGAGDLKSSYGGSSSSNPDSGIPLDATSRAKFLGRQPCHLGTVQSCSSNVCTSLDP